MAAFNKIIKKMKQLKHKKEETKAEEQGLVTCHTPLSTHEQNTWLMITDGENDGERHLFYSITENRYYVGFVPELQNKYVVCCYGGLLVVRDKSTDDCSILNMFTMKRFQLPPLNIDLRTECIISSPKMDGSCRVIYFSRGYRKFWSCHLGDSEFIERDLTYTGEFMFRKLTNFKGKLYGLTSQDWNLLASDFVYPDLQFELVVSGESLVDFIFSGCRNEIYLVESCDDLLLISVARYGYEVSDVLIFRADLSIGEWVKVETLGDRVIFLDYNNNFSYPAAAVGMKGNAIYWVRTPFPWLLPVRHLYMYDIEDKSFSVSSPFPVVGTYRSLCWVSFPMTFTEDNKMEQRYKDSLFEASTIETSFHLKKEEATIKSMELQIEKRKTQKREETKTIFKKESLWADLPYDLLVEIFPLLFAGDLVAFRSVCSSWYSVPPPLSRTTQKFVGPLKSSGCSSPLLMCPDNKLYNPIHGELYSMKIPDISGAKVRAARGGWFLVDFYLVGLAFWSPFSEDIYFFPDYDAKFYYSVYFSSPPRSADGLVVVAAKRWDSKCAICFSKSVDEDWTEILLENHIFKFSYCNPVVYQGMFYFLGDDATLLIFDPKRDDEVRIIEAPEFISDFKGDFSGEQYMLESDDGKLIAVFVSTDGSSVYPCEWNVSTSKWEIIGSLGNKMLYVSRPLSICTSATVSRTGNKIYFPRVVGDGGHILFYSLATKRYHTFEMGTSYSNFSASKFYPEYNSWFMP